MYVFMYVCICVLIHKLYVCMYIMWMIVLNCKKLRCLYFQIEDVYVYVCMYDLYPIYFASMHYIMHYYSDGEGLG